MTELIHEEYYFVELKSNPGKSCPAQYFGKYNQFFILDYTRIQGGYELNEIKQYWPMELPIPPKEKPREGRWYWVKRRGASEYIEFPLYVFNGAFISGPFSIDEEIKLHFDKVEEFKLTEPPVS